MTTDTVPGWVLLEAAKRAGWIAFPIEDLRDRFDASDGGAYRALCDMIAKHEQEPVDRKLLVAREAAAQISDSIYRDSHWGVPIRLGNTDDRQDVRAAHRAIELWEEGFGA